MTEPLTSAMPNGVAWRLSQAVDDAEKQCEGNVGDRIDHGLIYRRVLEEHGFQLLDAEDEAH